MSYPAGGIYFFSHFIKFRRPGNHGIIDPGKRLDIAGDGLAGIDQGLKFFHYIFTVKYMNRNLRDAVSGSIGSGGFYVN